MRLFFSLLCGLLLLAAALRAEPEDAQLNPYDPLAGVHPPLAEALRNFGRDSGRWAYTQHIVQYGFKQIWESRGGLAVNVIEC